MRVVDAPSPILQRTHDNFRVTTDRVNAADPVARNPAVVPPPPNLHDVKGNLHIKGTRLENYDGREGRFSQLYILLVT